MYCAHRNVFDMLFPHFYGQKIYFQLHCKWFPLSTTSIYALSHFKKASRPSGCLLLEKEIKIKLAMINYSSSGYDEIFRVPEQLTNTLLGEIVEGALKRIVECGSGFFW